MALIGLDIGSTGCKCTVFREDGSFCAYQYKEYKIVSPVQGYFEINPSEVWEAVKTVIKKAMLYYRGEKVTAISVSSFGEAAVPVDSKGRILANSFLYTDSRGHEQCRRLIEKIGLQNIMNLTGLPAHPMYTINKIM